MIKNANTGDMKTLSACMNKLLSEGYEDELKPTDHGMASIKDGTLYTPKQVKITNYFRFEGASDPMDNAILYAIETNDGKKATVTDAYGAYADSRISDFIREVEEISKNID